MPKKFLLAFIAIGVVSTAYHALGLTDVLPWSYTYTDVMVFAKRALSEGWIYVDKTIEYPVFIGIFISIVGKLSNSILQYYFLNSVLLIVVGTACTYLLTKLQIKRENIYYCWIFAPSIILFLVYNWDIWAIFFTILAFYLFERKQFVGTAAALGFGFICKLYPGLLILPLLLKIENWKTRLWASLSFIFVIVASNIFFAINSFKSWVFFYHYNSARGADYGSIWKVLVPLFPPWLYDVATLNNLILVLLGICFSFILWKYRKLDFIEISFLFTIVFLILNKVFSPQYTLWLLPFFVLLSWKHKFSFYSLEIANVIYLFTVLAFIFPPHYKSAEILSTIFMIIRWAALVWILVIFIREKEIELHA